MGDLSALSRLVGEGQLERVGRGIYRAATRQVTEHHGLLLASVAVPAGVVCLLSALSFHSVGTQVPQEVWIAVDRRAARPGGRAVRVYNLAKTLADAFKYRNKIGTDVAVEALRQSLAERKVSPAEIDRYSRICRVERVMRPYLEALAG